jgi:GDPmannose 4,6-dehydratase
MFGEVKDVPQREETPFNPRSPYGVSKVFAYWLTKVYRDAYGIFASNGILFNHESPRRGETFVTRKITIGLARVKLGHQRLLKLGNMDAKRDWGFAQDYVEAIWRILQQKQPDDFVIATGKTHTVREFVEQAGKVHGYDIQWQGKGVKTRGVDRRSGKVIVETDPRLFRPAEVDLLIGDASKAHRVLKWKPKVTFAGLAKMMAQADLEYVQEVGPKKIKVQRLK